MRRGGPSLDALRLLAALALAAVAAPPLAAVECGERAPDASRIAVAGGSVAEILYALDEQDRIIAADRTSNHPPAALELPQVGYVRNLSAEGLLSLSPTLVLGEHDMGPPAVLEQLDAVDIDVLRVPESFDRAGIVTKVRCIAAAVGSASAGERVVAELPAAPAQSPASSSAPAGIVLLGLRGGAPVAAGRDTSGAGLLAMAGARNLFDDFEGWKPVSLEAMARAAPDFIVLPERGVTDAGGLDSLLAHPALRLTPAARERRVIAMDGMAMLGFGLRTVDAARTLAQQLDGASTDTGANRAP